eukprot:TRINITY_DN7000_c0_g1_i1.p1 TRINITY_DN7000_c0_g1~~TRINITY_DN7000_c0_g1_i1.p1  ORF type:complete len:419 (+),score=48.64 TRINITY_DN7000_c0_g1_i1:87-1343(+)
MSLDSACPKLYSDLPEDIVNGLDIIINTSGNASGVLQVIQHRYKGDDLPQRIIYHLSSGNPIVAAKACWALHNICSSDQGINAVYSPGLLYETTNLLGSFDPDVFKHASYLLTNLLKYPAPQNDFAQGNYLGRVVTILNNSQNDDLRGLLISILSNLAMNPKCQLIMAETGLFNSVSKLLYSNNLVCKAYAVRFVLNVSTDHDSVRRKLYEAGVVTGIAQFIYGKGTESMQDMSIDALINLSILDDVVQDILLQNLLPPIVGLLSSGEVYQREQSLTLLSNLAARGSVLNKLYQYNFSDPIKDAIEQDSVRVLLQALRVVINASHNEFCREIMLRYGVQYSIAKKAKEHSDNQEVKDLSVMALKNLKAEVIQATKRKVDEMMSNFEFKLRVSPPKALPVTIAIFLLRLICVGCTSRST